MEGEVGLARLLTRRIRVPDVVERGESLMSNPALSTGPDLDGHHGALGAEGGVYIQEVTLGQPYLGYHCPLSVAPWWVGGFLDELYFFRLMEVHSGPFVADSGSDEIMAMETPSKEKGSNIKTLEPFEKKLKQKEI